MSTAVAPKPKVVIALDLDYTLIAPGMKKAFYQWLGVDYADLNRRFKQSIQREFGDKAPSDDRPLQHDFIFSEMRRRRMFTNSFPPSPTYVSMRDFIQFGRKVKPYPGVPETMTAIREAVQDAGAEAVFVVITNAYEPIVRSIPFIVAANAEVYGQRFESRRLGSAFAVCPTGTPASAETKPAALQDVLTKYGVDGSAVVVGADGYSDEPLMAYAKNIGARVVGIWNTKETDSAALDGERLRGYKSLGKIDEIVHNEFEHEGATRNLLVQFAVEAAVCAVQAWKEHGNHVGLHADGLGHFLGLEPR